MIVGAKQMSCGGCGHGQFRLFTTDRDKQLLLECVKCPSVSTITVRTPELEIGWGENANGIATVMPPRSGH